VAIAARCREIGDGAESTVQVREVGNEATARGQEMSIVIGNALALIGWHDFRSFLGDFTGGGSGWSLIGFLLAIMVLSALATEAALALHAPYRSQSRARWPIDVPESAVPESPGQTSPVGSGTRTYSRSVR
jgi:hypothetical protein